MGDNGVEVNVHRVEVSTRPLAEMKTQDRGEVEASQDAGSTKFRRRVSGEGS